MSNTIDIEIHGDLFSSPETAKFIIERIQQAVRQEDVILVNKKHHCLCCWLKRFFKR